MTRNNKGKISGQPQTATIGILFAIGWNSVVLGKPWDYSLDAVPDGKNYERGRLSAAEVKAAGVRMKVWSSPDFTKICPAVARALNAAKRTPGFSNPIPYDWPDRP